MTEKLVQLFFREHEKYREILHICSRSFKIGAEVYADHSDREIPVRIEEAKKYVSSAGECYYFTKDEVLELLDNLKKDL